MAEWASVSINDPKAPHWGGTLSAARMIMGKVGHSVFDYANKVIGPLLNSVLPARNKRRRSWIGLKRSRPGPGNMGSPLGWPANKCPDRAPSQR